ncbi:MAG TPA: hypothetical protein VHX59_16730 [Mycobacteriales bacterium]|jgi:hypothetical protein|nr:hypothetical protein [Mycobacteriales bacterium]
MVEHAIRTEPALLGIYLNDHFAGASGGVDLARRLAGSHRDSAAGRELERIAAETAEDRDSLRQIMADLEVKPQRYKAMAASVAEKLGRLKLNGRLLRHSPLSSVIELEAMRLGVEGKAAGWRTLRMVAEDDPRLDAEQLDWLIARAREQADTLEELRVRALADALVAG